MGHIHDAFGEMGGTGTITLKLARMHNAKALTQPTMDKVVVWTSAHWPRYPWKNISP